MICQTKDPDQCELVASAVSRLVAQTRVPRRRSRRDFAEAELRIPEGKHEGTRFRWDTLPVMGLIIDEIDSGRWCRVNGIGPVQGGKTWLFLNIPGLYHLFEMREPVIVGCPTEAVARDKWAKELLPVIKKSRYAKYLPTEGPGSQGGFAEEIVFGNGARLKFMSAGGGEEKRSGYTARVLLMTEVDKMDTAAESGREAPPISLMEDRLRSYDDHERYVSGECTVTIESGHVWQEHLKGTGTRVCCKCSKCGEYVTPEREHLRGWQEATSETEARRLAYFVCPACGGRIDNEQREAMNRHAVLAHRGQTVDRDGTVCGDVPEVETFSVRWNAFNNLFWSIGSIAVMEWNALHSPTESGEEDAEKTLCQKYWVLPYKPDDVDLSVVTQKDIDAHVVELRKGVVPADTRFVTVGLDIHKYFFVWDAIAWLADGRISVFDHGEIAVETRQLGLRKAFKKALDEFRTFCVGGWACERGGTMGALQCWMDAFGGKDWQEYVYDWCKAAREGAVYRFRPCQGYGMLQHADRVYKQPTAKTKNVQFVGHDYHLIRLPAKHIVLVQANADTWKSLFHERLILPPDAPGACQVCHLTQREKAEWSREIMAEEKREIYVPERGNVIAWHRVNRKNHHLDSCWRAMAAGHFCQVKLDEQEKAAPPSPGPSEERKFTTPTGEPFLITQR